MADDEMEAAVVRGGYGCEDGVVTWWLLAGGGQRCGEGEGGGEMAEMVMVLAGACRYLAGIRPAEREAPENLRGCVFLGQMTYLVASLTHDSANSCVMRGASCTQRKIYMLVVIIVTVVIVVVTLIVVVVAIIGLVIVVVIIGIVVVFGDVSFVLKLSFVIISFLCRIVFYYLFHQPLGYGWTYAFHQDKASSVRVPVVNVTLFSSAQLLRFPLFATEVSLGLVFLLGLPVFAMVAARASQAVAIPSSISCRMVA
nr:hypothetical protein [Tanacetum cinerariifolium]